jgi:hypothetical protein
MHQLISAGTPKELAARRAQLLWLLDSSSFCHPTPSQSPLPQRPVSAARQSSGAGYRLSRRSRRRKSHLARLSAGSRSARGRPDEGAGNVRERGDRDHGRRRPSAGIQTANFRQRPGEPRSVAKLPLQPLIGEDRRSEASHRRAFRSFRIEGVI